MSFTKSTVSSENNVFLLRLTTTILVFVAMTTRHFHTVATVSALLSSSSSLSPPSTMKTLSNDHTNNNKVPLYIVFGRPGAGKTTVAERAVELCRRRRKQEQTTNKKKENDNVGGLVSSTNTGNDDDNEEEENIMVDRHNNDSVIALDLDVCVPGWMKEKFGKGIYPTLTERTTFASDACDYVEKQITIHQQQQQQVATSPTAPTDGGTNNDDDLVLMACVVSFSFVNTDLRDVFRLRFPTSTWILIDTTEEEATRRIRERKGHFYKGEKPRDVGNSCNSSSDGTDRSTSSKTMDVKNDDVDNSEWKFAPVTFPHIILNGDDSVEENAQRVAEVILSKIDGRI